MRHKVPHKLRFNLTPRPWGGAGGGGYIFKEYLHGQICS